MEHMGEAIWVKQMLRIMRPVGIARPEIRLTASTPPSSPLDAKLESRHRQDGYDCEQRPHFSNRLSLGKNGHPIAPRTPCQRTPASLMLQRRVVKQRIEGLRLYR